MKLGHLWPELSLQVKQENMSLIGQITRSENLGLKSEVDLANLCYVTLQTPKEGHSKTSINYKLQILHVKKPAHKKKVTSLAGVIDCNHQKKEIVLPLPNRFYFGYSLEQF